MIKQNSTITNTKNRILQNNYSQVQVTNIPEQTSENKKSKVEGYVNYIKRLNKRNLDSSTADPLDSAMQDVAEVVAQNTEQLICAGIVDLCKQIVELTSSDGESKTAAEKEALLA